MKSERGAAAVEFALVVPILIVLVLGIAEFGRAFFIQSTISGAAREGVRRMALLTDSEWSALERQPLRLPSVASLVPRSILGVPALLLQVRPAQCHVHHHLPRRPRSPGCSATLDPTHRQGSHAMQRLRKDERGAVAIIVALVMVVLLGFAAIAVDISAMWAEKRQLQNGADAGALAIAQDCAKGACGSTGWLLRRATSQRTATAARPRARSSS